MLKRYLYIFIIFANILFAKDEIEFNTSLVGFYEDSLYKGTDNSFKFLPLIYGRYNNLYIDGLRLGYTYFDNDKLKSAFELSSDFLGYKSSDSKYLSSLEDKKNSIDGSIKISYKFKEDMKFSFLVSKDINSTHNSFNYNIKFDYDVIKNIDTVLVCYLSFDYYDEKKANYYFGVNKKEADIRVNQYKLNSTINKIIGVNYKYDLFKNWSLLSSLKVNFLDKEISNSPIIKEKSQNSFLVGVTYVW